VGVGVRERAKRESEREEEGGGGWEGRAGQQNLFWRREGVLEY